MKTSPYCITNHNGGDASKDCLLEIRFCQTEPNFILLTFDFTWQRISLNLCLCSYAIPYSVGQYEYIWVRSLREKLFRHSQPCNMYIVVLLLCHHEILYCISKVVLKFWRDLAMSDVYITIYKYIWFKLVRRKKKKWGNLGRKVLKYSSKYLWITPVKNLWALKPLGIKFLLS